MREDVDPAVLYTNRRRNLVAQALYAFGALLCLLSTYLSIAFIFLVQLYFVIAPPLGPLWRRIAPQLYPVGRAGPPSPCESERIDSTSRSNRAD